MIVLALPAAAIGLCVGSYAATAAIRAARAEPSHAGRSHCDGCGRGLGFAATVPVLSFVALGGRCATCGERIDPIHPAGEALGGMVAAAPFLLLPAGPAAAASALGLVLLAAALNDLTTRLLPDAQTLAAAVLCALLALQHGAGRLLAGLAFAAAAFAVLEAARRGFLALRRRPGLGFGDVKLFAALALWLGPAAPWALVLACAAGLAQFALARPRSGAIAFGPAIAAAGFTAGLIMETASWPSPS
jgi:leader peptidase (prepilin peptidase)/N-methyltransferase